MAAIQIKGKTPRHDIMNDGPEPTAYDKGRHEVMRLRKNGMYGQPKIFGLGTKPPKPVCPTCDLLMVWCKCEKNS